LNSTIESGETILVQGDDAGSKSISFADRYELFEEIGRGGMGVVFRARHLDLDRIVAVKRILPESASSDMVERFLREKKTIAKLNHQNILTVHDSGEDAEGPWLAMEYVEGGHTLNDRLVEGEAQSVKDVVAAGLSLCSALFYSHSRGIIHRDVKPTNVLVTAEGVLKLSDFGLARGELSTDLSMTGCGMGTMAYAAPEQLCDAKNVDLRADIYGLGATLYHLATGHFPQTICSDAIPDRIRSCLMKALSRRPGDRFASADEMAKALEDYTQYDEKTVPGAVCPNPDCGAQTPAGEKYCTLCGTCLVAVCPKCGGESRMGTDFCSKCGIEIQPWIESENYLRSAQNLLEQFDFGPAIGEARAAEKACPGRTDVKNLITSIKKQRDAVRNARYKARKWLKTGQYERSEKMWRRVLELVPNDKEALKALRDLQPDIRSREFEAELLDFFSRIREDDYESAKKMKARLMKLAGACQDVKLKEALDALSSLRFKVMGESNGYLKKARQCENRCQWEDVAIYCRQAIELFPENDAAQELLHKAELERELREYSAKHSESDKDEPWRAAETHEAEGHGSSVDWTFVEPSPDPMPPVEDVFYEPELMDHSFRSDMPEQSVFARPSRFGLKKGTIAAILALVLLLSFAFVIVYPSGPEGSDPVVVTLVKLFGSILILLMAVGFCALFFFVDLILLVFGFVFPCMRWIAELGIEKLFVEKTWNPASTTGKIVLAVVTLLVFLILGLRNHDNDQ